MSDAAALRRPQRRPLGPPTTAEAASARIAGISASALMGLFFLTLMLPIEPRLGPIRLTPYNALQLVLFVPLLLRFRNDPSNRLVPLDFFMAFYVFWIAVVIYHHHGTSRAVYIVNQTVTVFGGYLIGRVMIRNAADYRRFFTCFFWSLLLFLPFAIVELLTKHMLVSEILAKITTVLPRAGQPPRLGLFRVQGFTGHSISFGLYCSLAVANFFYIYRDELAKRLTRTGMAAFMTFISLSSAPNIALGMQILLIAWDRTLRIFAYRWWVLGIISAVVVVFIQLGVEGGLVGLVIDNFAFDPQTGYGRVDIIFHYGSLEVIRHPIFGIGLNDWVRPWWKKSSVDNFWLITAMRFGLPTLLALCIGLAVHTIRIMGQKRLSEEVASYRRGYLVAGGGLIFVLATVSIWGAVAVMVMAYIGAGAWFYTGDRGEAPETPPRRRADARVTPATARRRGMLGGVDTGGTPASPAAVRNRVARPPPGHPPGHRAADPASGTPHAAGQARSHDDRDIPQAPRPAHPARAPGPLSAARYPDGRRALRDLRHRLGAAVHGSPVAAGADPDDAQARRGLRRARLRHPAALHDLPRNRLVPLRADGGLHPHPVALLDRALLQHALLHAQ